MSAKDKGMTRERIDDLHRRWYETVGQWNQLLANEKLPPPRNEAPTTGKPLMPTTTNLYDSYKTGERRTYVGLLKPGMLPMQGATVHIKQALLVPMTEEFNGSRWRDVEIDLKSAVPAPGRWMRAVRWIRRAILRQSTIPRARVVRTTPAEGRMSAAR